MTYAQQGLIEKFDPCAEEVSSESQKLFKKAYSFYQDGKFDKAFPILRDLIENESDFASPYFLMGLIGVGRENTKMIEKYFPLAFEVCPDYSHPLLFYYLVTFLAELTLKAFLLAMQAFSLLRSVLACYYSTLMKKPVHFPSLHQQSHMIFLQDLLLLKA